MNSNAITTLRTVKRPARTEDESRYVAGIDAHSKVLAPYPYGTGRIA